MGRYRVAYSNGIRRRPQMVNADWYQRMGDWIHFFVRRADGGAQTLLRLPATSVAEIVEEGGDR